MKSVVQISSPYTNSDMFTDVNAITLENKFQWCWILDLFNKQKENLKNTILIHICSQQLFLRLSHRQNSLKNTRSTAKNRKQSKQQAYSTILVMHSEPKKSHQHIAYKLLVFIKTHNTHSQAKTSNMAQCFGYHITHPSLISNVRNIGRGINCIPEE